MNSLQAALLPSAMMGTDNRKPEMSPDAPEIVKVLANQSPEHVLLGAWAVAALQRQSGYRPPLWIKPLPDPAPEETQPVCSAKATPFLEAMMTGVSPHPYYRFLQEGLRVIARKGLRIPHDLLPTLFDLVKAYKSDVALAQLTSLVMGERGRWLASKEKRWRVLLDLPRELPEMPARTEMANIDELIIELSKCEKAFQAQGILGSLSNAVSDMPVEKLEEYRGRLHRIAEKARFKVDYVLDPLDFRYDMLRVLSHEQPASLSR